MSEPPPIKRQKLNLDQQRHIEEISTMQEQLDILQDENYAELKRIEEKFENLQKPFLERRNEIAKNIPQFWITSIKKHPKLFKLVRCPEEEECLNYLAKIEVQDFENRSGFCIRFHFDENPYFKNKTITKEYRKFPSSICRHSPIAWKNSAKLGISGKNVKLKKKSKYSFFGWFMDFRAKIETDEIARMFKEELWKNPLVFYSLPLNIEEDKDEPDGKSEADDTDANRVGKRSSDVSMVPNLNVRPLLVCGPSGSGKSTLLKRMFQDFPDRFGFTVSHTTRKPRPGEVDGVHYHFTDEDAMRKAIDEGKFIESAVFGGNYYGTSYASVQAIAKSGKVVVLDVDVQGVKQLKNTSLNPWSVFIKPPSAEVLKQRLIDRKTETSENVERRMNVAEEEIKYGLEPGNFDLVVENDDLGRAYKEFKSFVVEKVLGSD